MLPGKVRHDPWKNFRTKGVVTVTWASKLWALNANISKTAKDTNFKFGRHAPPERPNRIPEKIIFGRGRGHPHVIP